MDISLYIHWPFCKSKCPYCDFNSHVSSQIDFKSFEKAYIQEINNFKIYLSDKNIKTIFFGGGTPSLMPSIIVESVINEISKISNLSDDAEITLEANPTSVESDKFKEFKKAGINRVSLGIQSLNDKNLKFLGREHNANEALKALEKITIFDNYSFDLIYALPNQSLNEWEEELNRALQYAVNHLSLYQLTIEKGTRFYTDYNANKFKMPEDILAADMYNLTTSITKSHGFSKYEVSNYAKRGFESKHNLNYWKYRDYLGIGAGAHSRITDHNGKRAITMFHNPQKWLDPVEDNKSAIQAESILSNDDIICEKLLMGLRLKEGVSLSLIDEVKDNINPNVNSAIKLLSENDFTNINENNFFATDKGFLILNEIINKLLHQ